MSTSEILLRIVAFRLAALLATGLILQATGQVRSESLLAANAAMPEARASHTSAMDQDQRDLLDDMLLHD